MARILLTSLAALSLVGACASGSGGPRTPDEFRIVTKAPLIVPPEFRLRPPTTGQAQPAEVLEEQQTTSTFGITIGAGASLIEKRLVAGADATAVSPVIRAQVDYEEARILRKAPAASDRILDAGIGQADVADNATGGGDVIISRSADDRRKLPGT
ncbi:MAG: DUF3035 domain-containing protein [Henriciella sp.]|jgi:hypothetical protein